MNRYDRLQQRRIDPSVLTARLLTEAYKSISEGSSVKYAIGAMQPIDPEYTKNSFREGNRVIAQLENRLTEKCDYEYQGSTSNDTHIKAKSDIDILVLITRWFWLEPGMPNPSPYDGDERADLRGLRGESEEIIKDSYHAATVDASKSTAISVEGGSLRRRVEVVPATWHDTPDYRNTGNKIYRGVKVFDKNSEEFTLNRPFLFNHRVNERDSSTFGGMRKAARLMKSLKYDSDGRITMSSYNIVSIAWNMRDSDLCYVEPNELRILEGCIDYCTYLRVAEHERRSIRVPDDSRTVFGNDPGASIGQLDALIAELQDLARDIVTESGRAFEDVVRGPIRYAMRY